MATGTGGWKSDVPISMPRPLDGHGPRVRDNQVLVPMYGFAFTINGLFHDLSQVDLEEYLGGVNAPEDVAERQYADRDVS